MSKKGIKKSFHRSFRKSAEYSAALVFGVLFLVSSMYSVPNFSVTKSSNTTNDAKNLKTTNPSKLDSSYKRYCDSDDHEGICNYIAINDDSLLNAPTTSATYKIYTNSVETFNNNYNQSIRAPPVNI
jgi:hypothetical protein